MDEPSSLDDLSATANWGNANEEGATDETEWSEMNTEEVQDQCNYTDKTDQCLVEILNHYWHTESGKLMLKIDKILSLDEDTHEADTFRVYYAGCLYLYILKSTIGMAMARDTLIFRKAKEWRKWDEKFVSNTKKSVARLVRIFGRDYLEEIFGFRVIIDMMRPLKFHRL